jgi:hypothetical protein
MQEMHLSDHHLITAQISLLPDLMPLRQGRHLKKAGWPTFTKLVLAAFANYEDLLLFF